MTFATLNTLSIDMTQDDVDKLSEMLDRYSVMDVMDAIQAKFLAQKRSSDKKLNPPCWHIQLTVWDANREYQMSYGPFAGEIPNTENNPQI